MADVAQRMGATLVTVDDFDPLVTYSNYEDWNTPDPSQNPTWFNASEEVTGSPWHQGTLRLRVRHWRLRTATYHQTSVIGTKATFNFTGKSTCQLEADNRVKYCYIRGWNQLHHHNRPLISTTVQRDCYWRSQ